MNQKQATVIIPAHNEEKTISKTLSELSPDKNKVFFSIVVITLKFPARGVNIILCAS